MDDPPNALVAAIRIKAVIKLQKPLDVRLAIGIGDISYKSKKITECNGQAFIHSAVKFKTLKKEKQKLAVKSDWPDFDATINLCLKLGMIAMDKWSVNSAEMVALALSYPRDSQADLGRILKIKQNAVCTRFSRAHFEECINAQGRNGRRRLRLSYNKTPQIIDHAGFTKNIYLLYLVISTTAYFEIFQN